MDIVSIPVFVSVLTFMSIVLLFYGIYQFSQFIITKKKLISKIRQYNEDSSVFSGSSGSLEEDTTRKNPLSRFLNWIGSQVVHDSQPSYGLIRVRFLQAGVRHPNAVFIFWGVKLILALSLVITFLLLEFQFSFILNNTISLVVALVLAFIGFYIPNMWLSIKTDRRKETLSRSFPDALDLMVVCVEAGVGLDSAFNRVAEEFKLGNPELSQEFKLVNLELRAGKARKEALENLARRTGLEEIKSFSGLMIQTLQFGTSISKALRVYADTFRTNRRQKAEEMAAKLPVKLLFPTILFIFPSLFIVIMGPAVIRIAHNLLPALG